MPTPRSSALDGQARLFGGIMIFLVIVLAALAKAAPAIYVDDRAQNYLMRFGYLPQSGPETGNLRTDEQLREAIKSLQKFAGIPVTGEIDDRTQELMRSRRCGRPDFPDRRFDDSSFLRRFKRYTLHGTPWKHLNLTWSLRTERPSGLETGRVRRELSRALGLWAMNSKLTFREINSDAADILIYFYRGNHGDGYSFDGKGQILAHAFFPGSDRGGDAHFDEEEEWTLGNSDSEDGTSLFAVAAHEFGHSLGLAHSSVRGALMYAWYQGITENYELPEDDKHGIQQMYGAPDRLWGINADYHPGYRPGSPPRYTPRTPSTTPATTTGTTQSTTTTPRPRRTRPREPVSPRDRYPYRPNHYPEERPRQPYYPEERPRQPYYPEERPRQPYYPEERPRPPNNPVSPDWPTRSTPATTPSTWKPHRHHPSIGTVSPMPPTRHRHTVKKNLPDKCDTSYDAISMIRRELFIFKGRYVWRLNDDGLVDGFPAEINQLFKFPMDVDHVDAVYERRSDNKIVFFIGREYYVFKSFYLEPGYPKPLTNLGLPKELEKIDGAMIWGYNKQTYFFSGHSYWRFDESANLVELTYPRNISMFAGVGANIDAVFQWKNGTTYFFKGKHFWQFDDKRMKVAHKKPKSSAHFWMGCPRGLDTNDVEFDEPTKKRLVSAAPSSLQSSLLCLLLPLLVILALQKRSST